MPLFIQKVIGAGVGETHKGHWKVNKVLSGKGLNLEGWYVPACEGPHRTLDVLLEGEKALGLVPSLP